MIKINLIYNKLKLFDLFFSFLPIKFILFILLPGVYTACVTETLKDETQKTPIPYQMLPTQEDYLAPALTDLVTESPKENQSIWSTFILPTKNVSIGLQDLFLGVTTKQGEIFIPPNKGYCRVYSDSNDPKKLYIFTPKKNQSEKINLSVLFIVEKNKHEPFAIVKTDVNGEFKCYLPNKSFSLLDPFGNELSEISSAQKVFYQELPSGQVEFEPHTDSYLSEGDMIRIGRAYSLKEFEKESENQEDPTHYFNFKNDLLLESNSLSREIGVDEFFKTTFLIGKSKYQMNFPTGQYTALVLRKNKIICINKLNIKKNEITSFECNDKKMIDETDSYFKYSRDYSLLDPNFPPQKFLSNLDIANWVTKSGESIIISPSKMNSNAQDLLNDNTYFSFVFSDKKSSEIYRTNYEDSINNLNSIEKIPISLANDEKSFDTVPYSNFIFIYSRNFLLPYFLNYSNVFKTNGTTFILLDPNINENGYLSGIENQEFRLRIYIPKWNSTEIIEMYVDSNLQKRWIINRGDISKDFSVTIGTKTFLNHNFSVKFTAKGTMPLPNFLTGKNFVYPYAETRTFCVTLDGTTGCNLPE